MRYGSVCSGIEATSLAWEPLGMAPSFVAETDEFCNAVLSHQWPAVANIGDITSDAFIERARARGPIDILVGGTPCQGFSIAGSRGGIGDPRSALATRFIEIAEAIRPQWVVWENVPGSLTTNGGRDFGTFVGRVAQLGYGWCYRVLDAQFFGVPHTRRRVFLVGRLGGECPGDVLFDTPSEGQNSGAGVSTEAGTAPDPTRSPRRVTGAIAFTERGRNGDGTQTEWQEERSYCLRNPGKGGRSTDRQVAIHSRIGDRAVYTSRRLTPRECERLQGMPDDYTLVSFRGARVSDTHRYRAIGNSMAVPVMAWIGRRLLACESNLFTDAA